MLVVPDRDPSKRIRDLAAEVGITERAVQRILAELVAEGFLRVTKSGRCNKYSIVRTKKLRHPLEDGVKTGELLKIVSK